MALVCEPIDQKRSPLSRDEVIARHRSIVAGIVDARTDNAILDFIRHVATKPDFAEPSDGCIMSRRHCRDAEGGNLARLRGQRYSVEESERVASFRPLLGLLRVRPGFYKGFLCRSLIRRGEVRNLAPCLLRCVLINGRSLASPPLRCLWII
ncbi:MAG: hypothetical protein ACREFK_02985 [Stellaceae bacterium]